MMTQQQREAVRRDFGPGTVPIMLLAELEAVEDVARGLHAQITELGRANDELVARIHRAVLDIHHAIQDLSG
jgi:hypothetical protein